MPVGAQVGEYGGEDDKRCYAAHQWDGEEVAGRPRGGERAAHQPPDACNDIRYKAAFAENLSDPDTTEDDDPKDGEDPTCTVRDRWQDRFCWHTGEEAEEDRCPDEGEEWGESVPDRCDSDHHKGDGKSDECLHRIVLCD